MFFVDPWLNGGGYGVVGSEEVNAVSFFVSFFFFFFFFSSFFFYGCCRGGPESMERRGSDRELKKIFSVSNEYAVEQRPGKRAP